MTIAATVRAVDDLLLAAAKLMEVNTSHSGPLRRALRRQCLTYALDLGTTLEGVWGGTTPNQRRAMLAGKYPTMLAAKIDHRRQRAAALRAAGWEVERIAKHLGISVATVGSDLRCVQQQAAS